MQYHWLCDCYDKFVHELTITWLVGIQKVHPFNCFKAHGALGVPTDTITYCEEAVMLMDCGTCRWVGGLIASLYP